MISPRFAQERLAEMGSPDYVNQETLLDMSLSDAAADVGSDFMCADGRRGVAEDIAEALRDVLGWRLCDRLEQDGRLAAAVRDGITEAAGAAEQAHAAGYDNGIEHGYEQGYADGYAEGEQVGHSDGHAEGYAEGLAEAEERNGATCPACLRPSLDASLTCCSCGREFTLHEKPE